MDENKKVKKGAAKAEAGQDIIFNPAAGNDMVNFGGDDENQFSQKQREHNVIRKYLFVC